MSMATLLQKMIADVGLGPTDARDDPVLACLSGWCDARRHTETSVEDIFRFLKGCFTVAKWSPECNVIAMVLLVRLAGSQEGTPVRLNYRNWDKLLLCSLLLAQKLWDDVALNNAEFPKLWALVLGPDVGALDLCSINALEQLFLHRLHFDVHVDRTTYTQVYFELYSLCGDDALAARKTAVPLTDSAAEHLMVRSSRLQSELDGARADWAAAKERAEGAAQPKQAPSKAKARPQVQRAESFNSRSSGNSGSRLVLDGM